MKKRPEPADRTHLVYSVLDATPGPVIGVQPDGVIDYANPRAVATFGYAPEELVGRNVDLLVPEEAVARHRELRREFAAHPRSIEMGEAEHQRVRRKDGTVFPAEISLTPVETHTGLWVIAAVRDLSPWRAQEERLSLLSRSYRTLAELNEAIVRAPDAPTLYREVCQIAVERAHYLGAWVGVRRPDGSVACVAEAGGLRDYIAGLDICVDEDDPRGRGPTGTALREGRPCFSADFLADRTTAPWHEAAKRHRVASSATLPLHDGLRTTAVLNLYSSHADIFDPPMRALLAGLAENVSFALRGFEATERLQRLARERTLMAMRLIDAQDDERRRIAADVHDDTVQSLAAADLRLALLRSRVQEAAPGLVPDVVQLQEHLAAVTADLRDLLFDLESPDLSATLPQLVEEAAAHIFEHTGIECVLTIEGAHVRGTHLVAPAVRAQGIRIVKEALVNVRKHARASRVEVCFRPGTGGVEVVISDDGIGLVATSQHKPGHHGLASMSDRALVVGGWLRLEHPEPPLQGTRVRFWLPGEDSAPGEMAPTY